MDTCLKNNVLNNRNVPQHERYYGVYVVLLLFLKTTEQCVRVCPSIWILYYYIWSPHNFMYTSSLERSTRKNP